MGRRLCLAWRRYHADCRGGGTTPTVGDNAGNKKAFHYHVGRRHRPIGVLPPSGYDVHATAPRVTKRVFGQSS